MDIDYFRKEIDEAVSEYLEFETKRVDTDTQKLLLITTAEGDKFTVDITPGHA